jgi:hypothetical protein
MKRILVLGAVLFLAINISFAQEADTISQNPSAIHEESRNSSEVRIQEGPDQKASVKDKLYFGGYFNFSLGSYSVLGVEPMVGYKLTPRLSLGAKFRYDYISDKRYAREYNTHTYGASVFSRLVLVRQLYLHAEYAGYNYELYDELGNSSRHWVPFFFLGAGFSQRIGTRTSLNAQVLFDVLQNKNSPYRNWEPFYSVGIGVGF